MHRIWENVLEVIAYFSKLGLFSTDWLAKCAVIVRSLENPVEM